VNPTSGTETGRYILNPEPWTLWRWFAGETPTLPTTLRARRPRYPGCVPPRRRALVGKPPVAPGASHQCHPACLV